MTGAGGCLGSTHASRAAFISLNVDIPEPEVSDHDASYILTGHRQLGIDLRENVGRLLLHTAAAVLCRQAGQDGKTVGDQHLTG